VRACSGLILGVVLDEVLTRFVCMRGCGYFPLSLSQFVYVCMFVVLMTGTKEGGRYL